MKRRIGSERFQRVAFHTMSDVLYEKLIDDCWKELRYVFDRPEVRKAQATIMRAIAEAFSPTPPVTKRGRKANHRRR